MLKADTTHTVHGILGNHHCPIGSGRHRIKQVLILRARPDTLLHGITTSSKHTARRRWWLFLKCGNGHAGYISAKWPNRNFNVLALDAVDAKHICARSGDTLARKLCDFWILFLELAQRLLGERGPRV